MTRLLRPRRVVARVQAARSNRELSEAGYTLYELGIAMLLLSILFLMTAPILVTLTNTNTYVNDTYNNENQLLPVSTNFQRLIRSVVSPGPTLATTDPPVPAFGVYQQTSPYGIRIGTLNSNTSYAINSTTVPGATVTGIDAYDLTFFTNTGNATGPAMVVAQLNTSTQVFTVTISYPNGNPQACPRSETDTNQCSYPVAQQRLITVTHVVNYALGDPVFTYNLTNGTVVSNPTSTFANCDPPSAQPATTTCPASQIESLGVDLKVNTDPNSGSQADDQTVIYELSPTSQAFDPVAG